MTMPGMSDMAKRVEWRFDGVYAFHDGKLLGDCPYDGRMVEGRKWFSGWRDAARLDEERREAANREMLGECRADADPA